MAHPGDPPFPPLCLLGSLKPGGNQSAQEGWETSGMVRARGNASSLGAWMKPVGGGGNGRAESPSDHQLKRPIPTPLQRRPPCLACTCPWSAQLQGQREAGVSGVWRDGESQQGRVTSRSRTSSPSLLLPVPRRFPRAEEGGDHTPETHTLLHPHSFAPTSQTSSSGSGWRARPGPASPFQLSLGIHVGGVWGTPSQGLPGTKVTPGPPSPFPALDR